MKKINGRYRNNNNFSNTIYSLNYKFDSNSIAGKISGTALDLIKRYNDLAKDAHSNNDYVAAEVFRQYAEHYRKIVTEINERRSFREQSDAAVNAENAPSTEGENENMSDNGTVEAVPQNESVDAANAPEIAKVQEKEVSPEKPKVKSRRSFHVIEVGKAKSEVKAEIPTETESEPEKPAAETETSPKPKRVYRRRAKIEA